MSNSNDNYRVNDQIQSNELRVIDPDGENLGTKSKQEAIDLADKEELDLVEVAPDANPPVAKILDYGKFKYEKEKEAKKQRKSQKVVVKEVQLSPKIADHDLQVKIDQARRFLGNGNKVRVNLRFKGREIIHTDKGQEVMDRFYDELSDVADIDSEAKKKGYQLTMMLKPS